MTPDQLSFGLAVGFLGALVSACGLWFARPAVALVAYRLGLLSLFVLFVCSAAVALGLAEPALFTTIGSVTQPFFYGAMISFDRFSVMFVSVGSAAALLSLPYASKHERPFIVLATLALTGLATVGNIIGIAFFLAWLLALVSLMRTSRPPVWQTIALHIGGWLSVAGIFVASAGALFSDLQAVASYAGSLPEPTIFFGTLLSAIGCVALALVFIERDGRASALPHPGNILLLIGTMYVAWRTMLFIMPVLSPLLGTGIVAVGVILLLILRRDARLTSVLMAQFLVGLGLGVYAIALENWQLMNLAVFGSVLLLVIGGIAAAGMAALEHVVSKGKAGGLIKRAPWMSLNAALLIGGWAALHTLCLWMFLQGVTLTAGAPGAGLLAGALFVLTVAAVVASIRFAFVWFNTYCTIFLGSAPEDGLTEPMLQHSWPIQAAGMVSVLAVLLAPSLLSHMGAGSLTNGVGQLAARITAGGASLSPFMLVFIVVCLAVAVHLLRGLVQKPEVNQEMLPNAAVTEERLRPGIVRIFQSAVGRLARLLESSKPIFMRLLDHCLKHCRAILKYKRFVPALAILMTLLIVIAIVIL